MEKSGFIREFAREIGINEQKIEELNKFIKFSDEDIPLIRILKEKMGDISPAFWDQFYQHITSFKEVETFFRGKGILEGLKKKQSGYFKQMVSGNYDMEYFLSRLRIGITHDSAGVNPMVLCATYSTYCTLLIQYLEKNLKDPKLTLSIITSLLKVIFLDLALILHAYFFAREKRLSRAQKEIEKLNRIHWVLSEINSLIVREKDRERLFMDACKILVESGGFSLAWIGIYDPSTKGLLPAAAAGKTEYLQGIVVSTDSEIPEGRGPGGTSIRDKKVVVVDDLHKDSSFLPWKKRALKFGFKSMISFPLNVEEKTVGALLLYSDVRAFFSESEIELLEEVASDISLALEYIEKREEAERLLFWDELTGIGNSN